MRIKPLDIRITPDFSAIKWAGRDQEPIAFTAANHDNLDILTCQLHCVRGDLLPRAITKPEPVSTKLAVGEDLIEQGWLQARFVGDINWHSITDIDPFDLGTFSAAVDKTYDIKEFEIRLVVPDELPKEGKFNFAFMLAASPELPPPPAVAPMGTIMHAVEGNSIAVLYHRDTELYYNTYPKWNKETLIASGTINWARVAVDSNGHLHIACINNDQVEYMHYNGTHWSVAEIIASNHSGLCRWVDIAIDNNDVPHLVYVDTKGNTDSLPDLMYATRASGTWVTQILKNSYYNSSWKQGQYFGEKPPYIAYDADGNRYIMYQWRSYDHSWSVYHDRGISVECSNTRSLGYVGSNTNRFDLYDFKSIDGSVYALYRNATNIKVTRMTTSVAGNLGVVDDIITYAGNNAYAVDHNNGITVAAGVDTLINGSPRYVTTTVDTTISDATAKGNRVCIARYQDDLIVMYTDTDDDQIKLISVTGV